MNERKRYRRRPDRTVVAVRLSLDTDGFDYRKWGAQQRCKQGDWLVDNDGEVYSVDAESFAKTYREVRRGTYLKITPIWARSAVVGGHVETKEGHTPYGPGDYLVSNNEDGTDAYAVSAAKFAAAYELDE